MSSPKTWISGAGVDDTWGENLRLARRIAIVGSPGAGKSTFARNLHVCLGLPVIHLDTLFWLPNWVERTKAEFDALHADIVAQEKWIIDGNYTRTQPQRFPRAEFVFFLDYPMFLCLFRALKRNFTHRNNIRPDITAGCEERMDKDFLRFIMDFRKTNRPRILTALQENPHLVIFHFTRPKQLTRFLSVFQTVI